MNNPRSDQQPLELTVCVPPSDLKPGMVMFAPEHAAPRTIASITPHDAGNDFDHWQIEYRGGGGRTWPNRDARIYI